MALQGGCFLLALHGTGGASNVEYLFLGNDGYFQNLWRKKWLKQWEVETPGIDEVVEFVSGQIKAETKNTDQVSAESVKYIGEVSYGDSFVCYNQAIIDIANKIIIEIIRRNIELEDEDVEILFLV